MIAEIRTLFWLQSRLIVSMFRSRRLHLWARLGRILLMLLMLVSTIPLFLAFAGAMGYGMTRLSPAGAFELVILVNCVVFFLWLLLPGTYSSEILERFEMTRLFIHPVSLRSLVVGSTLISLFNFVGVWTVLIMAGEIVGLAWHKLWAIPLILLGAIPTFAVLVLAGRIMDDVFDLVASDRRLKGLLVFLFSLPFFLLIGLNYVAQFATNSFENMPAFLAPLVQGLPPLDGLGFSEAVDTLLTHFRLSRYLIWTPPGWATAGMSLFITGRWWPALGALALSVATAGGMLWLHGAITRRLMRGAALRIGEERVKSRSLESRLPGPAALWTLFHKDWLHIRRSPITKRVLFSTPIAVVAMGAAVWQAGNVREVDSVALRLAPLLAAAFLVIIINLSTANFTSNWFGSVDREGFATLMVSSVERRYIWMSANLATLALGLGQCVVILAVLALIARSPAPLLWGTYLALCLHVSTAPAYNLTSALAPYRTRMEFSNQGGNIWIMFAWLFGSAPVMALFMIPPFLWEPGSIITLPLAGVFSACLYIFTLRPLSRLLDRRTHQILQAVTQRD